MCLPPKLFPIYLSSPATVAVWIMDDTVFVIHEVTPRKGIKDGVALHAVIIGQVVVVAQPLEDGGLAKYISFALLERVDIALAFINVFCHGVYLRKMSF